MDSYQIVGVAILLAFFWGFFYAVPYYWRWSASSAAQEGRFADAERCYLKALAISPRDAALWRSLGLTRRELGAFDGALEALQRAGELAPGRAEIFADRVEIFRAQGRFEEALRELDWVVENNDAPVEALLTRAGVAIDLKRFADAEADCDRAIDQADEASSARAFNLRGVARLGLGREEDAEIDFETAYLIDPQLLDAQARCAESWIRRGAPEKTLLFCESALRIDPNSAVARRCRALAKEALGDLVGAEEDARRAEELERQTTK